MSLRIVLLCCLVAFCQAASRPYIGFWSRPLTGRVVGGVDADEGEFPHQISLQHRLNSATEFHICGGSILNNWWILTAAHCVLGPRPPFYVKAGKHNMSMVENTEQRIQVETFFAHKKYAGDARPYDIALLKLQQPLVFNNHVQPVELPIENSIPSGRAVVSGWGITNGTHPIAPSILQKADLFVTDLDSCNKTIELLHAPPFLHETNICAGPLPGVLTLGCRGDSGGPLTKVRTDGKHEVIGIASWIPARFCDVKGAPTIFTRVSAFNKWIESTIANNSHILIS